MILSLESPGQGKQSLRGKFFMAESDGKIPSLSVHGLSYPGRVKTTGRFLQMCQQSDPTP
jgi:hypothetical protein